jgi:RsiW-degrading membrane proteinase PrsW (M82 family)
VTIATQALPGADVPDDSPGTRRTRSRLVFWVAVLVVIAASATCGWLLYREFDDVMGLRQAGYGLMFAAIPAVPIGALFWWLNRTNPEPRWMLVVALLWGGLAATLISLHLNEWLSGEVGEAQSVGPRSAVYVAPWTEELTKSAIVFALVIWRGHRFNGVMAGVILGGLAGLGFAFTENVLYYGQYLEFQGDQFFTWEGGFEQLFLWRGVKAPFVHPMFTMCTGFGIGLAVRHRNIGVRILAPAVGFCVAALLHMGYNGVASLSSTADALNAFYVAVLLPTLFVAVTLVLLARRVESRAIAARLGDYTVYGWIKEADIPFIVDTHYRWVARHEARQLGKAQRRTVRDFQRCGMALGVLRDRMVRGVAGAGERRAEHDLVARFRRLRAKVVLPGVAGSDGSRSVTAVSSW